MGKFARLLVLLLVAAFAAAALAPAAEATAMTVKMLLADSGDSGCDGCPADDGDLGLCDQACTTSLPALPANLSAAVPAVAETFGADTSRCLFGWTWPPDPSPPRRPS